MKTLRSILYGIALVAAFTAVLVLARPLFAGEITGTVTRIMEGQ